LIANWNSVVGNEDKTYIPGDFLYKGSGPKVNAIFHQLKGTVKSTKSKNPVNSDVYWVSWKLSWKDSNYTTSKNMSKFHVVKFKESHEYSVFIKCSIVVYFGL